MKGAIIYRWGPAVRGREQESLEVFTEAATYWNEQLEQGRISSHEPYFSTTRNGGYWIMKGDVEELNALAAEEEFQRLVAKVQLIVEDWSAEMCVGGSIEDVGEQIGMFQEVISDLT